MANGGTYIINSYQDGSSNADWGVSEDTYIRENDNTATHGASVYLIVGDETGVGGNAYRSLMKLEMPEAPIEGAKVKQVDVVMTTVRTTSFAATSQNIYPVLFPLDTTYTGVQATWRNRKTGIAWASDGGDYSEEVSNGIDGQQQTYVEVDSSVTTDYFSHTYTYADKAPGWGDIKWVVLSSTLEDDNVDWTLDYGSNRWDVTGVNYGIPKLQVTYTIPKPEGFENADDKLSIAPSENDKTEAELTWGSNNQEGFTSYKVYRWKSGASDRSTTLTTITDQGNVNHIDSIPTTGDTIYYYQIETRQTDDYDNTTSILSNSVEFWRPSVASMGIDDTTPDAWQEITGSITSSVTNKPGKVQQRKYMYDWEGDDTVTQTVELEVTANSNSTTHTYPSAGARTPRGRIESSDGFWSDYTSASQVTVGGLYPIAKVKGTNYMAKDVDYIFRADESYDQNSDGTVDSYLWDWAYSTTFAEDETTTVSTASHNYSTTGAKTMALKVADDDGNYSESVLYTTTVYDDDPITLEFSNTRITARNISDGELIVARNNFFGGDSDNIGEIVFTGKDFPTMTLEGTSIHEAGRLELETLEDYSDSPTRLRLWISNNNKWYTGYLVNLDKRLPGGEVTQETNYWSAEFICDTKE